MASEVPSAPGTNEVSGQPDFDAVLRQHVAVHIAAASRIEAAVRGWVVRRRVRALLNRAVAKPELGRAKEYARSLLPRDQDGRLLPLGCNVACFKVFGSGVYVYMRWVRLMQYVFLYAFTLSLANLIHNVTGGGVFEGQEGTTFLNAIFAATVSAPTTTQNRPARLCLITPSVVPPSDAREREHAQLVVRRSRGALHRPQPASPSLSPCESRRSNSIGLTP